MTAFHEIVIPQENIPAVILLHSPERDSRPCELHWHESVELLASLDSRLHVVCGEQEFDLMENSLALINSAQIHRVSPLPGYAVVSLSLRLDAGLFQKYTGKEHNWFDLDLDGEARRDLTICCRKLYELYSSENEKENRPLEANALIFHIAYLLTTRLCAAHTETQPKLHSQKYSQRYRDIMQYMDENYDKPLTLDDVAKLIHISREHLSREFATYVGSGFREQLTAIRLIKAHKDLLNSDLPLIEVAIRNGFSDLRAYNRAFRKYYGVSPSSYRQNHNQTGG